MEWLTAIFRFFVKREPGWDKFSDRIERRLERTEQRLDECEEDRHALRYDISELRSRIAECDNDREQLTERVAVLEAKTQ